MNLFNKVEKVHVKVNLIVLPVVFIIILIFGIVVNIGRYYTQVDYAQYSLNTNVKNIETNLDIFYKERTNKLNSSMKLASELFYKSGALEFEANAVKVNAINQITKEKEEVEIFPMMIGGNRLLYNYEFVDKVKEMTGVTSTIFQKIPQGFLRVSTNVMTTQNERAVNTFIPNSSPVAQAIESGVTYNGRAFVVTDWYLTVYEPIVINGKVEGMLYVGVLEKDLEYLSDVIEEIKIFEKGGVVLVDKEGKNLVNHFDDTTSIAGKSYLPEMVKNGEGYFEDTDAAGDPYLSYYKYVDSYQAFIVARAYKADYVYDPLRKVMIMMLLGVLVGMIIFGFLFQFLIKTFTRPIKKIAETLILLSEGVLPKMIKTETNDEIGLISKSTNHLIDGISKTAKFANEIGKGNLDSELEVHGENDVLGNSLLNMRQSLVDARAEEEKRKVIDGQINWATEGYAKFGELLRANHENSNEFYYTIITNLVKYVNANQGGLFILNDDYEGEKYLELVGMYAYDRRKFAQKRIEIGQDLVGQCFLEGKTIYMTQIPQNYVHITSGLGDSNPSSLILIPLKSNDLIYGVIELASFNIFENHMIQFLEKIGESFASSISAYKINQRTVKLLRDSKLQSEELAAQEEEIRQNMEELQTTQEESSRMINEMTGIIEAFRSTVMVAELDFRGKIQFANEKFASCLDENPDKLIGADWARYRAGDSTKFQDIIDEVSREEYFETESQLYNNTLIKEHYRLVMNIDGLPVKIMLVITV